jgi:peptide/nickel transport system substrate-binding protein
MTDAQRRLDTIRSQHSEVVNHYIDELTEGRVSRREFVRRGTVVGLSASVVGTILSACGNANGTGGSSSASSGGAVAPAKQGGTMRIASVTPAAAVNPLTIADEGGLVMLQQTGEFLIYSNNRALRLDPMLATSWKPNHDATVWTFELRKGVTFHDGRPLTADDVVYTFKANADPKAATNALSAFEGVLTPSGVQKAGPSTVRFHLEAPNGNFPYLVSSDNYNMIIVPNGTDFSKWQKTFIGTGPFKLKDFVQQSHADFVANPKWWGGKATLNATTFNFYANQQPETLALEGSDVDVITQLVPAGAQALLSNPSYSIIKLQASQHRELSMRNDQPPFNDPRVRQAMALTLDRTGMVSALLSGDGQVGNDSPFAPVFPSTDKSVPQRTQDLAKAKQLLAAAGHPNGISATLYTEDYQEIPTLAQAIQASARKAGINIKLQVKTQGNYYGKATFGNSDWLDGQMSLVDYGHRGVPNVFLEAPLESKGPWNAAHFKNPTYDKLVKQYVAAVDLSVQRKLAGQIERLLLEQTPLIVPYFIDGLTATTSKVTGVNPTSTGQVFLSKASFTA